MEKRRRESIEGHGRKQRQDDVHRRMLGVQNKSERFYGSTGKTNAYIEIRRRRTPEDTWSLEGDRDENIFARPTGPREKVESEIAGEGPGPAKKMKQVYQESNRGSRCTGAPLSRKIRGLN